MKTQYLISIFVFFVLGGLVLFALVPDYQEKNSQTEILAMLVASNEVVHDVESGLVLDKDSIGFVYSGEVEKENDTVDPRYHVEIESNGNVILEYNSITITRAPMLKEGKLQWSCSGTPKEIMPESCK